MKRTPLVSVIIPSYNVEKFISRTLKSVINQTYNNLEIIVVDDGSKDNTVAVIKYYKNIDSRIRLFTQSNQGVSVARNIGLDNARGEFIAFLDSDDFWDPQFIEVMVSLILSSSSEIAFSGYRSVTEDKGKTAEIVPRINEGNVIDGEFTLLKLFNGELNIWIGSTLFNRAFLGKIDIKFIPGAKNGQDSEFIWKAILKATKVVGTKQVLSNYFIRENSLSKNPSISKMHELGCRRRFGYYLTSNTKNEELINIFEKRILPRNYSYLLYFLAIRGYRKKDLVKVAKNKNYRKNLKKVELKYAKLLEYLAIKSLLFSPSLTLSLFRLIGRHKRKDLT
jgi:glycosyltransferase involved in cell wall biosynthesis